MEKRKCNSCTSLVVCVMKTFKDHNGQCTTELKALRDQTFHFWPACKIKKQNNDLQVTDFVCCFGGGTRFLLISFQTFRTNKMSTPQEREDLVANTEFLTAQMDLYTR